MPSEARQKKIMEKLNRAQKCSILGPQNLGSGGARAPGAPLDPHMVIQVPIETIGLCFRDHISKHTISTPFYDFAKFIKIPSLSLHVVDLYFSVKVRNS